MRMVLNIFLGAEAMGESDAWDFVTASHIQKGTTALSLVRRWSRFSMDDCCMFLVRFYILYSVLSNL